ncbi:MAG: InlB B-repeat-containing protein [Bacilli bacterium]|nr:InlB B-repeat-containing protein [Bacilli bacterium]
MKKKKSYLLLYIIIGVFLIGIGYAEIGNIDLNIEGEASMDRQTGAVITSVNYVDGVMVDSSQSKINSFYQTLFNSKIVLDNNSSSSITYQVTVKNLSSLQLRYKDTIYDSAFYDNSDIGFTLSGIDTNTVLNPNDEVFFQITFSYSVAKESYSNTTLNSVLNFQFEPGTIDIFQEVYRHDGACTFSGDGSFITGSGCSDYHNDSCINTGVNLYSEENVQKDFEISFDIVNYDRNTQVTKDGQPTLVNSKYENSSLNYPGFVFRATSNLNTYELTSGAVPGASKATVSKSTNDVQSVKIVRKDHILYYSFNGDNLKQLQNITTFNTPFNVPVTIGCSLKENNDGSFTPYRYFDGTISNMKIKLGTYISDSQYFINFDPNGGSLDKPNMLIDKGASLGNLPNPTLLNHLFDGWYTTPEVGGERITSDTVPSGNTTYYARWSSLKELNTVFELSGECHFYGGLQPIDGDGCGEYVGQNYINTGIQLFTEENIEKDFEITFDLVDAQLDYTSSGFSKENMTLVNAKYEVESYNYPGFCFRRQSDTNLQISSRINQVSAMINFTYGNYQTFSIKRADQKLYYSTDNGDYIYIHDYRNMALYFDTPVTVGASHDANGNPFRYFVGTIKNLKIKMSDS